MSDTSSTATSEQASPTLTMSNTTQAPPPGIVSELIYIPGDHVYGFQQLVPKLLSRPSSSTTDDYEFDGGAGLDEIIDVSWRTASLKRYRLVGRAEAVRRAVAMTMARVAYFDERVYRRTAAIGFGIWQQNGEQKSSATEEEEEEEKYFSSTATTPTNEAAPSSLPAEPPVE